MADLTLPDDLPDDPDVDRFEPDQPFHAAPPPRDFASEELTTDDLEAAYLRALESMEDDEWADGAEDDDTADVEMDFINDPKEIEADPLKLSQTVSEIEVHYPSANGETAHSFSITNPVDHATGQPLPANPTPPGTSSGDVAIARADFLGGPVHAEPGADESHLDTTRRSLFHQSSSNSPFVPSGGSQTTPDGNQPLPNATRIIEACLFVGGQPLSTKRLATLLESTGDPSHLDQLVDELNLEYASQQRPYEIRLGDGGYRMALRTEFEAVRNRVYGVGPREVKLSQDVLEVLALVAYQQPIAHSAVEASGKANVANILRQLLRRELITLVRIDQSRNGVEYRTSPRFLQVFGLGHLNELPRPEDLAMR